MIGSLLQADFEEIITSNNWDQLREIAKELDAANMADHSAATLWFVLPSLPMFLAIPALMRSGAPFYLALGLGCLLTVALYFAMTVLGPRFGLRL